MSAALPISKAGAMTCARWLMEHFGDKLASATQGKAYQVKHVCAIACQETAYKWLDWLPTHSTQTIIERSVFDASGDYPGTSRSAFPTDTAAFRNRYGDEFTSMLIEEANLTRRLQGWGDKSWVYKGYGLFQYDLQHVGVDEAFFRDKEWYSFDSCLRRLCQELDRKLVASNGDLWQAIRRYNGSGPSAEQYMRNVKIFTDYCEEAGEAPIERRAAAHYAASIRHREMATPGADRARQVPQRYVELSYPPFPGPQRDIAFLCGSPSFDPSEPFIVTLFFHGFDKPLDVQVTKHELAGQMAKVDQNVLLVCPRIAVDRNAEHNPGRFEDEQYFNNFLSELPDHILALVGQGDRDSIASQLKAAAFVIASFSAGHGVASQILKFTATRSRTACCILFDSMYRRDFFFESAAEILKYGALVLVHTPTYDDDSSNIFADFPDRIREREDARIFPTIDAVERLGPDRAVIEAVSVPHWQSVSDGQRLAKALNKVAAGVRTPQPASPRRIAVNDRGLAMAARSLRERGSMRARVISETLNVRSNPSTSGSILGVLSRGEVVEFAGPAQGAPRWAAITYQGGSAFVARRLIAQVPDRDVLLLEEPYEKLVTQVIRSAAQKYDDIAYRLGCKAKAVSSNELQFSGTDIAGAACSGHTVDCSGWVAGLFQLIADNVNHQAAATVFSRQAIGAFSTHSDGQIASIGNRTGQVWSGTDIDELPLRSGLLLGLNNADYDWEGEDRVFEIDHIVMCVRDGNGYAITQSSSGGGGVNTVPWSTWRSSMAARFTDFRVHCVDPLLLGDWPAVREATAATVRAAIGPTREPSPFEALAG